MLTITVPEVEVYDSEANEFRMLKAQTITLEHSLVSISKWESHWNKPFLGKDPMTEEQTIDYIRCMTLTQNVDPSVYYRIDADSIQKIKDYIEAPMTATTFSKNSHEKPNREIVTSELIYYWMIALEIPFECQKWHLNRLLTLVRVCNVKNAPSKKMSKKDIMAQNRALNAARRAKTGSKG